MTSRLHLHHPERTAGPCDPHLVREEIERVKRAARFAADVAWDQRCGAACGDMNNAFWNADHALVGLPAERAP